jgi:FdhD protein
LDAARPRRAALAIDPSGSVVARGRGRRNIAVISKVEWQLAEEVPIALSYNGRSFAVMMATPADIEDFGLGFSLAEDIIDKPGEMRGLTVVEAERGIVVQMTIPALKAAGLDSRGRSLEGRSGCGLCGVSSLEGAVRDLPLVHAGFEIDPDAVGRAFAALPDHQPINRINRSVHAAAWCAPDGAILLAREDVGRHNALDKLIGAMAKAEIDPAGGFAVMTSRCSFELVQKAATVGIPLLATISAPTALALSLARQAGMTICSLSRADGVVTFD